MEEKDIHLRELIEKERDFIIGKFNKGIQQLRSLYQQSIEEYQEEAREDYQRDLDSMKERVEEEWRRLIEQRVAETVEEYSFIRQNRMNEIASLHNQIQHISSQFQTQRNVLSELKQHQEFQKSFIAFQSHILNNQSLHADIEHLVSCHWICFYYYNDIHSLTQSINQSFTHSLIHSFIEGVGER